MQIYEGCESAEEVITYMDGFDEQLAVFEANTKVEDCIHVIKLINYSFKCIPSLSFLFFTPPSTSSNHWRCVQKPWGDLFDSLVNSSVSGWRKREEPTCNQHRRTEERPLRRGEAMVCAGSWLHNVKPSRLSRSSQRHENVLIKKKHYSPWNLKNITERRCPRIWECVVVPPF